MAHFLTLSKFIFNIDCVQQVQFLPDPPTVSILWASGYEETIITGQDALVFMDAVNQFSVGDLTTLPSTGE
ncbi:hypothetical protein [Stenomitos frigidus]|uniref:Uncharacterized protein n=1 Tax=Stenomitos frigidus ULC18 TaxID=2107698 RepID=A0A2T1ELY9_9CYAN|nr:hypothetical protein [Stenomitos frigidus]PSB33725.1 hypothetical protein C7B82_04385 [Stenomitos frigidus ULC18]